MYNFVFVGTEAQAGDEIGLDLYPNPSTGIITLRTASPLFKPVSIEVTDMHGVALNHFNFSNILSEVQMDLQGLSAGVYILKVTTSKGVEKIRLVIVR
mgnify:CR=1 FL=1